MIDSRSPNFIFKIALHSVWEGAHPPLLPLAVALRSRDPLYPQFCLSEIKNLATPLHLAARMSKLLQSEEAEESGTLEPFDEDGDDEEPSRQSCRMRRNFSQRCKTRTEEFSMTSLSMVFSILLQVNLG